MFNQITDKKIRNVIREAANLFSSKSKETILFENYGKHLYELKQIVLHYNRNTKILDVGGGLGFNLICLKKLFMNSIDCYLIDKFEEYDAENRMGSYEDGIKIMEQFGIIVVNQDFYSNPHLPFDSEFFDIVTIFDVVEHLPSHPLRILKEIKRVLRNESVIILSGPNSMSLIKKINMLLGNHPYIDFNNWLQDKYFSHIREYNIKEYQTLLSISEFKKINSTYISEPTKTRFINRYSRKAHSRFSLISFALFLHFIVDLLIAKLRPSIYSTGIKQ